MVAESLSEQIEKEKVRLNYLDREIERAYEQTKAYYRDPFNYSNGGFDEVANKVRKYDLGICKNNTSLRTLLKGSQEKVHLYESILARIRNDRDKGKL
ncbi:MAG: hypothetical protein ACQESF_03690 [Nanobdellota archaeon]